MFLVEWNRGRFINAERIDRLNIYADRISFTLMGDAETFFRVESEYTSTFLNHLQVINQNTINIQTRHEEIKSGLES
jgi:hypothetical protein